MLGNLNWDLRIHIQIKKCIETHKMALCSKRCTKTYTEVEKFKIIYNTVLLVS